MPWRSRWSGARLSRTAASGANADVSSSWNDDASQTTTAAGSSVPGERRQRRADVAGDGDRQPGLAVDLADQLGRRRLAVGAGDRDHLVGQQPPAELELAEHLARRARARRATTGASCGTPGLLTSVRTPSSSVDAVVARVHRDAGGLELGARRRRRPGRRRTPATSSPARAQRERGRPPRAGEADDEERAGRQRRAGAMARHSSGRARRHAAARRPPGSAVPRASRGLRADPRAGSRGRPRTRGPRPPGAGGPPPGRRARCAPTVPSDFRTRCAPGGSSRRKRWLSVRAWRSVPPQACATSP